MVDVDIDGFSSMDEQSNKLTNPSGKENAVRQDRNMWKLNDHFNDVQETTMRKGKRHWNTNMT